MKLGRVRLAQIIRFLLEQINGGTYCYLPDVEHEPGDNVGQNPHGFDFHTSLNGG